MKSPQTLEEKAAAAKAREAHDAAVQGDVFSDPFKDTSGPALNIVMKLQAVVPLGSCSLFGCLQQRPGASWHPTQTLLTTVLMLPVIYRLPEEFTVMA